MPMRAFDDLQILCEDDNTIIFRGQCNYSLDTDYSDLNIEVESITENDLGKYVDSRGNLVGFIDPKYRSITSITDKARLLNIEIEAFSEYEAYLVDSDEGNRPYFQHFVNGQMVESRDMSFHEAQAAADSLFGIEGVIPNYYDYEDQSWVDQFPSYSTYNFELTNEGLGKHRKKI